MRSRRGALPAGDLYLARVDLETLNRALLDPTAPIPADWPAGALGVFLLFLVPIGGGIPAGVLMARDRAIAWPVMMGLYLVSDVVLACVFEPFLRLLVVVGRAVPPIGRFARAVRDMAHRTAAQYGSTGGPLGLVLVSFGVDPMTGRAAAAAAGHGFLGGWAIAITGDMFYFALLMVSTLWLGDQLGDERLTIAVMLLVMLVVPSLVRRWRSGGLTPA